MGRLLWLSCMAVLYMAHCASLRVPAFLFALVFMAASFFEFCMPLIAAFRQPTDRVRHIPPSHSSWISWLVLLF